MEPHEAVAFRTYIHDRERKMSMQKSPPHPTADMSNDLMIVDVELVKNFASTIESACVLIEGAPNDQPCPIHASVGEIRHFVHYMRQLDTEFRNSLGVVETKTREIQQLKSELAEARRATQEAEAKRSVAERKYRIARAGQHASEVKD